MAVLGLMAVFAWLDVAQSVPAMLSGLDSKRHPTEFDFEFSGLDSHVSSVPVELFFYPATPIAGITVHYAGIRGPAQVDSISRSFDVAVRDRHVRFSVPLALPGLSNFRLESVRVGDAEAPYALVATVALDQGASRARPPRALDIPSIRVAGNEIDYEGALALRKRTAGSAEANPLAYSSRVNDLPAQLIWNGLRALRARVDLARYPLVSFVVPGGWQGHGWKNEAYRLTRPHAVLTDLSLALAPGVTVPLPISYDCASPPQFAMVARASAPAWSQVYGLWRPERRAVWDEFHGRSSGRGLTLGAVSEAAGNPSLDRVDSVDITTHTRGTYRLFAACRDPHYDSTGVTWIDVDVRSE